MVTISNLRGREQAPASRLIMLTTQHVLGTLVLVVAGAATARTIWSRATANGIVWPVIVGGLLRLTVMLVAHFLSVSAGERGLMYLDDQTYLHTGAALASAWSAGHFANPAAYNYVGSYEFGFPVLVAVVFTLVGTSVLAVKLVEVALGTATVLMIGLLARRLAGKNAALRATWMAALMPTLVWWSAPMLKECLAVFLTVAVLLAVVELPSKPAAWGVVGVWIALFVTRSVAAGAIVVGLAAGAISCLARTRRHARWRAIGANLVVAAIAAVVLTLGLTGGHIGALLTEYRSTIARMFHVYEGGSLASVPSNIVKSLVTPLPWAFGPATRDWDRALYPGMWALYFLYPTAVLGLWRLRTRPESLVIGGTIVAILVVNASTSGFVFRQRSVIEPLVVILAVIGMRSWRQLIEWGAAATALAGVGAAINTGSPLAAGVVMAGAALMVLGARRAPTADLREPLPASPMLSLVRSGRAASPLFGVPALVRWVAHVRRAPRVVTGWISRLAALAPVDRVGTSAGAEASLRQLIVLLRTPAPAPRVGADVVGPRGLPHLERAPVARGSGRARDRPGGVTRGGDLVAGGFTQRLLLVVRRWREASTHILSSRGVVALAIVVFAALRVVAAVHHPITLPDSITYARLNFLGDAERPWTVPLMWTLFPTNGLRVAVQIAVGIAAWSLLALSLARSLSTPAVRTVAVLAVLLLGLVPQVAGWDATLISESLSTSLLVLLVASLISLTRRPSARVVAAAMAIALLWVFTRQVNTLLFLAVLPFLLAFVAWRLPRQRATTIGAALLVIAVWSGYAVTRPASSGVWQQNAITIISDRIAGDPAAVDFFQAHGLPRVNLPAPVNDHVVGLTIDRLSQDATVTSWVAHHFKPTYLSYLKAHWSEALSQSLVRAPRYTASSSPDTRATTIVPTAAQDGLWRLSPIAIVLLLGTTLVLVCIARLTTVAFRGLPLVGLLLASVTIGCVLIWATTDPAMDTARQFLPIAILGRLAVIIGLTMSADALIASRRWTRRAPDPALSSSRTIVGG